MRAPHRGGDEISTRREGSTEGLVGHSEPGGSVLRFASDMCLAELVDDDNNPVPAGAPSAKVLVTNLHNLTQPLMRYELTDRFTTPEGTTGAGWLRASIDGRADEVFRYGGVAVRHHVIRSTLASQDAVREHQVRQTERGIDVACVTGSHLASGTGRSARACPAPGRAHRPARQHHAGPDNHPRPQNREGQPLHTNARATGPAPAGRAMNAECGRARAATCTRTRRSAMNWVGCACWRRATTRTPSAGWACSARWPGPVPGGGRRSRLGDPLAGRPGRTLWPGRSHRQRPAVSR